MTSYNICSKKYQGKKNHIPHLRVQVGSMITLILTLMTGIWLLFEEKEVQSSPAILECNPALNLNSANLYGPSGKD